MFPVNRLCVWTLQNFALPSFQKLCPEWIFRWNRDTATFWLDEKKISKQKNLLEEIIKYDNTYSMKERAQII